MQLLIAAARLLSTSASRRCATVAWMAAMMLPAAQPLFAQADTSRAGLAAVLAKLPPAAKAKARAYLNLLGSPDSLARNNAMDSLEMDPTATPFFLAAVPREPNAWVRWAAILNMHRRPYWRTQPGALTMLRRLVVSDPDSVVAAEALYHLTALTAASLRSAVDERIGAGNVNATGARIPDWLGRMQERAIALSNGWVVPAFMRDPPPVFAAAPPDQPTRFLAFGDWGSGRPDQHQVAAAMRAFHAKQPFAFAITLGDNFYPRGLPSPAHERWRTEYEEPYSPMDIKVYASLGNHDQFDSDSPAAEIMRTALSPTWRLPSQYYTFTAGPAQFFAVDGNDFSSRQLQWLKDGLERSTAQWKIVYGHFPIAVASKQIGPVYTEKMVQRLLPILEGRADAYIAGHHHSAQHLRPIRGVHLFIAGSGGASGYASDSTDPRALFARTEPGFAVFEVDRDQLRVRFINTKGEEMYSAAVKKGGR